jgi:aminoglycoside phosphotransferase (APT) family kinase protein
MDYERKAIGLMDRAGYTVLKTKDSSMGADHTVILMWTDKGDYVARFCKNKNAVMTHAWACKVWSRYHLPKILLKGKDYSIETMTQGTTFAHAKMTTKEQLKVMKTVGKLLRQMHKVKTKRYGYLVRPGVGQVDSWKKYVLRMTNKRLNSISRILPEELLSKTKKYLLQNVHILEFHNPVLVHKDISADNIMMHDGKFSGIIDAADALSGDPMYEIAAMRDRFSKPKMRCAKLVSALESAYGKIDERRVRYYTVVHTIGRIHKRYNKKWVLFYVRRLEGLVDEI